MKIIESELLKKFPRIGFGFSTKVAEGAKPPYYFNLSLSVDDDPAQVQKNRELFAEHIGISWDAVALQKQTHSDIVKTTDHAGYTGEGDALLTDKPGIGLAVSSGDCCAIFIYDSRKHVIGGVHSGWRGTEKRILAKALEKSREVWGSSPADLYAYIAPAISWQNYEVGPEVAGRFPEAYVKQLKGSLYLDVTGVNRDILLRFGIPASQVEISPLCSFGEKDLLHSYRRDGAKSGRAYGIIYMKAAHV